MMTPLSSYCPNHICGIKTCIGLIFSLVLFLFLMGSPCKASEIEDLARMSIEELMTLNVTSVGKKDQMLSDSAAAIFVITNEDIERSGVTSIPDALRMVPGMTVARMDSNKWAVSCRGFNSRFSAKLLVLIDGRSVYTPAFSGVYWETNDVLLADVDRIEVVRGPGASLWGANAVNGVINIITKHAAGTQGGLVEAGAGDMEEGFAAARYGGRIGDNVHWRVYAKGNTRDNFEYSDGSDAGDSWEMRQTGFRMDADLSKKDSLTFQGDLYRGDIDQDLLLVTDTAPFMDIFPTRVRVSGANLLSAWSRRISAGSDLRFQVYFDRTQRNGDVMNSEEVLKEEVENLDLDFQHRFSPAKGHDVVWGLRYRHTSDEYTKSPISDIDPLNDQQHLYSAFLQDEIAFFKDTVRLTLGSKLEHNGYTGFEMQPTARVLLRPKARHRFWGAVSHAVRTPSRTERTNSFASIAYDLASYGYPGLSYVLWFNGNENFESEELTAYELGYRFLPRPSLSLDITLFYNNYDDLLSFVGQPPYFTGTTIREDFAVANTNQGQTYGLELAGAWQPHDALKCILAYTWLGADSLDNSIVGAPRHQVSVRGQADLTDALTLDAWIRYSDNRIGITEGDDYLTLDLALGWKIRPGTTLSLVAANLLAGPHLERIQEAFSYPIEVDRSFYAKLTYRF